MTNPGRPEDTASSLPGSPLAWVATLAGPLAVFGAFLALVQGQEARTDVENPKLVAMEDEVLEADPKVLFVGSSLVGRAVDAQALSRILGEPVYVLWHSNASTAQWFAMLKNRAYEGAEVEPEVVIVASTLRRMLLTVPQGERQRNNLMEQLGDYEPIIERKAFGRDTRDSPLARLKFQRSQLKELILDGVKGLAIAATSPTAGTIEEGVAEADPSLERIFGGENAKDFDLGSRVIPVVDAALVAETQEQAETVASDQSFISDIVSLAGPGVPGSSS